MDGFQVKKSALKEHIKKLDQIIEDAERVHWILSQADTAPIGANIFTMAGDSVYTEYDKARSEYIVHLSHVREEIQAARRGIEFALATYGRTDAMVEDGLRKLMQPPPPDPQKKGPGGIEKLLP